ncbi:phage portal protein [Salmonella enterica subsp. enterica serovar 4,12:d:-]|nr:phage portal protein [Salmonella enterica]EBC4061214.1 phage portal protein [Salmonella enterica]EDU5205120.1 phage portal protein [Salmonella enterica subsp. enterica serovar 4,12:d:-]
MWFKNKKAEPKTKKEVPTIKGDIRTKERLIKNPTFKRSLGSAMTTKQAIDTALGLGASFVTADVNGLINRSLASMVIASRDLSINNPIAKKYFTETASGVVGSQGIYVRPDVHLYEDEQENIRISQELESRFYDWCDNPDRFDINGVLDFSTFQNLVEKERAIGGEIFIRIHNINGNIKIELINGIRCPTNNNMLFADGHYISNGIEYKDGKPIAYYFMRYNPITYSYDYANPERVDASEILHYFQQEFQCNQERGIPDLVCAEPLLSELDSFLEASLVTKKVGSAVMGFIENDASESDDISLDDGTPNYFDNEALEPGALVELQPGQRLKDFSPKAATDGISEYVDQQMTLISMGLGITRQTLTGDTSSASYSASRLSDKIQQNTYASRTNLLKVKVLKPLYRLWLRQELLNNSNEMGLKFSDFNALLEAQYHTQHPVSLDPLKDAQYAVMMLDAGLASKAEIIAESGRDPAVVLAQIAKEKEDAQLQEVKQDEQGSETETNQTPDEGN